MWRGICKHFTFSGRQGGSQPEDSSSLLGKLSGKEDVPRSISLYKWLSLSICGALLVLAIAGCIVRIAFDHAHPAKGQPVGTLPAGAYVQFNSTAGLPGLGSLGETLKPGYHITSREGWLNDPNGMLFYKGLVHVFFQLNPYAPSWAAPWWGHVVSRDMVHWQRLPPALAPNAWFDGSGVFSGSALLDAQGVPRLLYTGVNLTHNLSINFYYQRQAWAIPADARDPFLANWTRPMNSNPLPIDPPPGGDPSQFRDPITPWQVSWQQLQSSLNAESTIAEAPPSGNPAPLFGPDFKSEASTLWVTAVGVQDDCVGAAAMYASPDLEHWAYAGTLFSQLSQNLSRYEGCMRLDALDVPVGARHFGRASGVCDQFGADCHMWECPDFFQVTDRVYAFKFSDQVKLRDPFAGDWYVLGDNLNYTRAAAQDGQDAFQAVLDGVAFWPVATDYGSVYASKSFQVGDKRLWLGWVYEDSMGCESMCGDGTSFTAELGWQGAQTLIRQVEYDPSSQRLRFFPLPQMELLRSSALFSDRVLWTGANRAPDNPYLLDLNQPTSDQDRRRQLEIKVNFSVTCNSADGCQALPGTWQFDMGLVLTTGKNEYTVVKLLGTAQQDAEKLYRTVGLSVYVDKRNSGGVTRPVMQGGLVDGPAHGHLLNGLSLQVFIDRSIVEVYAMEGRGRVTSRIYPFDTSAVWTVGLYGRATDASSLGALPGVGFVADAQVFEMDQCWVQSI